MRFSIDIEARLTAGPEIFCSHKHVRYAMTSKYIPNAFKVDNLILTGTVGQGSPTHLKPPDVRNPQKGQNYKYTLILTRYSELGGSGSCLYKSGMAQ